MNIYKDALQVQDACNLSGVVLSWARAMKVITDAAQAGGHGTDWVRLHPVNVLYADKVADLTARGASFSEAYQACVVAAQVVQS